MKIESEILCENERRSFKAQQKKGHKATQQVFERWDENFAIIVTN